jgi:quercetin dioxygenase-like cupin family protein
MLDFVSQVRRRVGLEILAGALAALSVLAIRPEHYSKVQVQSVQAAGSARPETIVAPLSCRKLPDIPGKAVTTATVTFPPNAYTPAHRHPGSVTVYVLKGAVRSQLEGGGPVTYEKGESWFEPSGILHHFAENTSMTKPAEILAVFVTDENCDRLVIPEF